VNYEREADRHAYIRLHAKKNGVLAYHTASPRGSDKGYPDWTLAGSSMLFAEDKDSSAKLRPEQTQWRDSILAAGQRFEVWRPRDFTSGAVASAIASIAPVNVTKSA
jgi:hypothetical protein